MTRTLPVRWQLIWHEIIFKLNLLGLINEVAHLRRFSLIFLKKKKPQPKIWILFPFENVFFIQILYHRSRNRWIQSNFLSVMQYGNVISSSDEETGCILSWFVTEIFLYIILAKLTQLTFTAKASHGK